MRRTVLLLGISILLTIGLFSCIHHTSVNDVTPSIFELDIKTIHNEANGTTMYEGPQYPEEYSESGYSVVLLRMVKVHNDEALKELGNLGLTDKFFQIYVRILYNDEDWRLYGAAYDSNGTRFVTKVISRTILFDHNAEDVGISVSSSYLLKHQDSGVKLEIYDIYGDKEELFLPGEYIKAFMQQVSDK